MQKDSKKISVVIPCYQHGNHLKECVQSVITQSYKNWECIIVNDGSTDNTSEIAKEFISEKIFYVHQENMGLPEARNTGINNATGEFILPLDADDTLNNDALKNMVNAFAFNNDILVVYSDSRDFDNNNKISNLSNDFTLKDLLASNQLFCTAMFKTIDVKNNIRYDRFLKLGFEDWEFWINLWSNYRHKKFKKIDYPVFNYRSHDSSMMKNLKKDADRNEKIFHYVYEKHKNLFHEFYPSYIKLLNRKNFYENKLETVYNSKIYKTYNYFANFFKKST